MVDLQGKFQYFLNFLKTYLSLCPQFSDPIRFLSLFAWLSEKISRKKKIVLLMTSGVISV